MVVAEVVDVDAAAADVVAYIWVSQRRRYSSKQPTNKWRDGRGKGRDTRSNN